MSDDLVTETVGDSLAQIVSDLFIKERQSHKMPILIELTIGKF